MMIHNGHDEHDEHDDRDDHDDHDDVDVDVDVAKDLRTCKLCDFLYPTSKFSKNRIELCRQST